MRITPISADVAAQLEYDSWIELLRWKRVMHCPNGMIHVVDTAPPPAGYYGQCVRCGHLIDIPF